MAVPPPEEAAARKPVEARDRVVIRFAGDSGDGMQLTGMQFTTESAFAGNDIGTLPDFPAEIRAPAGTLAGVSAFQLNFSSERVFTPGDDLDVLVAMNPAALRTNLGDLKKNGVLIVNSEAFSKQNLTRAGYAASPLDDDSLEGFQVFPVDVTKLTVESVKSVGLNNRAALRCRNFFALGLVSWLYSRPIEPTLEWIQKKFAKNPEVAEANVLALRAGFHFGETTEAFAVSYEVPAAPIEPGFYRNITGNTALALGLVAASQKSKLPLFLGSYPITPASDVLHELSRYKQFGIVTFQAEDEIAAAGSALGAAFTGAIGATVTSGPGLDLKSETIGLGVMVELPLVVFDIQRSGPSTGMPTKTEQADLLAALWGRHGESPVPVLAPSSPSDCFATAFEAVRIALRYMTPVIVLSESFLANGAEPWKVPKFADLPDIEVKFAEAAEGFLPYARDERTLARPWAIPGTPGLEHRIGGLSKADGTGNVSYSPANNEHMIRTRARKVAAIADDLPPTTVEGAAEGRVLLLSWGGTYGVVAAARKELADAGRDSVGHVHLRHLNPLPKDLGAILDRFEQVLVPELNLGQLRRVIRSEYLVDAVALNKIQGRPFKVSEVAGKVEELLGETK